MSKIIIPILIPVLIFGGIGFYYLFGLNEKDTSQNSEAETEEQDAESLEEIMSDLLPAIDNGEKTLTNEQKQTMQTDELLYNFQGNLVAVDGSNSLGVAKEGFVEGTYSLYATFEELPDPETGFFYEGWVVRSEPFSFISTGKIEKVDDVYTNYYSSETDYSDHTLYVLTIEPDDGDPAPAVHVLEGEMSVAIAN